MTEKETDVYFDALTPEQQHRLRLIRVLNQNVKKGEILFTGSSLMEQFPINELQLTYGIHEVIYNRGIGGFKITDMLHYMEEMVFATEPSKIFINIGTNDIGSADYKLEVLLENYKKVLIQIQERLPETEIYIMAYYPINDVDLPKDQEWLQETFKTRTTENLTVANEALVDFAEQMHCKFINVNEGLADERGKLRKEYTIEGVHMYANAYCKVLENMRGYLQCEAN